MSWVSFLLGMILGTMMGMFLFALLSANKLKGGRDDRP